MADLRIAFVGAGGMAQRHLKTLAGLLGEKPVAAVCDTDRAKASAAVRDLWRRRIRGCRADVEGGADWT